MRPERTQTREAVRACLTRGLLTIREVAERYGIATSTLSRALRRHGVPHGKAGRPKGRTV